MSDRQPFAGRLRAAVILTFSAGLLHAQAPEAAPPPGGLWLSDVGIFGNYYSTGTTRESLFGGVPLRSDGAYGGMATINLTRTRERSQVALEYTPSYSRRLRYHDWDALNQSLLFHGHRALAPRLRFDFSASGALMNADDFLFNPTRLSSLATRPGTAAELADLLGNRADQPGSAAAILAGSPEDDASSGFLLFGRRMLTSHVHTGVTYAHTPRLSIVFGFDVARLQHVSSALDDQRPVMPHVTTGSGTITVSYSLSPRTHIGGTASSMKHHSAGGRSALITTGRFNIERMLTQHWFVNASAGVGAFTDLRELAPPTRPGEFTGGGSLGYRLNTHTWMGSYDRRIGSNFGLATAGADSAGFSWHWFHPSNGWGLGIGTNWHRLRGEVQTEVWRGTATMGKTLTRYTAISAGFAYSHYQHSIFGIPITRSQFAVRTQFSWSPRGVGVF